jgi:hypothetical protein
VTGQKPSVGRIVHYVLSEQNADGVNRRRADASRNMAAHRDRADGGQVHIGNVAEAGQVCPLVIVRVWSGELVNGQVLLDGNDTLWVSSMRLGEPDELGTWHWPERV